MKNKGFSLVELIVVIAIMAILVGVAVPVYSSYIEKANAAKDEQLLGEINSAFAVVCAGNAIDINTVTDATIDIEDGAVKLSTMVVKVGSTEIAGFAEAMVGILGNDLEFAVIERISYDKAAHKFVDATPVAYAFGDTTIYLSPADIAALKNSGFYTWGVDNLLGKVNDATALVKDLTSGSLFDIVYVTGVDPVTGETFVDLSNTTMETIASMLGYELTDPEFEGAFIDLLEKKMAAMGEGATEEEALKEIGANATVLSAATGSTFDAKEFANKLANKEAMSEIKNANGDEQVAQIAMTYAMYASFMTEQGKPVNMDVNEVITTINGDSEDAVAFRNYMKTEQAIADMDGYLAAMNMINDSTEDEKAVEKLLLNGFADEDLNNTFTGALN